jgi:hypothetical protein
MTKPIKIVFVSALILAFTLSAQAQNSSVKIDKHAQIDALLKLKKELNADNTSSKNYKIQIYSGDMSGAKNAESKYKSSYKDWKSTLVFETPNYKVWIGNYRTSLEADRALKTIRETFDGAFIFKPKQERKQ